MLDFILAPLLVFVVLGGWLLVQYGAREFAKRHPQFGPPRVGGGCGSGNCSCSGNKSCSRK
jgi:hypothetical protein